MDKDANREQLGLLFSQLGLSPKQTALYSALLNCGEERVSTLAKKTGVKRGNAYALLKDMKYRGLVEEMERGGVIYFRAQPPGVLVSMIVTKEREIGSARQLAERVVPRLTEEWKERTGRPVVRYFAGEEGVRKVFEDIYGPKNDVVWGCGDVERIEEAFPDMPLSELLPKRVKNKLEAKSILAESEKTQKLAESDLKQLRETFLVSKDDYPLPAEIDIYQDRVAMLSFRPGDFAGVIVENRDFAQSLRSVFKLAMDGLRGRNPKK